MEKTLQEDKADQEFFFASYTQVDQMDKWGTMLSPFY